MAEQEPNDENIHYLDEYPHLERKVQLRRLGQLTLFKSDMGDTVLTLFALPDDSPPDGAA